MTLHVHLLERNVQYPIIEIFTEKQCDIFEQSQ